MKHKRYKTPKVLMVSSVASMIDQFNMPNIQLMQHLGYEVHVACNFKEGNTFDIHEMKRLQKTLKGMHVVQHQWDCPRIFSIKKCGMAYSQLRKLTDQYTFAWMHCHSPIGGALARIVAHQKKIRVIYTAHGFHFYKGAPMQNWLFYYPVERLLAHWTDVLITINQEDYLFAKRRLPAAHVYYIPGVGIDLKKYEAKTNIPADINLRPMIAEEKEAFCRKFGIPKHAWILLSVGELNKGKNHQMAIEALAALNKKDVYYLICGKGILHDKLQRCADDLGVGRQIRMPGYQTDMPSIYKHADIFVFPSLREGMPCALMEAMASGLPCVVSDIRGNKELIHPTMRVSPDNSQQMKKLLEMLIQDAALRQTCSRYNRKKIQSYRLSVVQNRMKKIYGKVQNGSGFGFDGDF